MKLKDAILQGEARAYGQFSDLIRAKGGTYRETLTRIQALFVEAGRAAPSDADIEDKMAEADDLESRA